jgi:hypothetical protein
MDLIRDVLDEQMVDPKHHPLGKVDGIVIDAGDGNYPPQVVAIESGFPTLARRLHPRLERVVRALGRRFGVRRGRTCRIPWLRVQHVGTEVTLAVKDADLFPTNAWETWLRKHVIARIPGGGIKS